jgi:hypothetical protein
LTQWSRPPATTEALASFERQLHTYSNFGRSYERWILRWKVRGACAVQRLFNCLHPGISGSHLLTHFLANKPYTQHLRRHPGCSARNIRFQRDKVGLSPKHQISEREGPCRVRDLLHARKNLPTRHATPSSSSCGRLAEKPPLFRGGRGGDLVVCALGMHSEPEGMCPRSGCAGATERTCAHL